MQNVPMYNIVVQVIYAKFKIKLHMQNPQHAQVYKIVDQVTYAKFAKCTHVHMQIRLHMQNFDQCGLIS